MPQELPGFYYDAEKNRYLAISGPFSGEELIKEGHQKRKTRSGLRTAWKYDEHQKSEGQLSRRIHQESSISTRGTLVYYICLSVSKSLCTQRKMFTVFWIYSSTVADAALRLAHANVETPMGDFGTELLLTGGVDGTLGLFEVGKVGLHSQAVHWRHIQPGSIVGYGCTVAFSHIRQAT